MNDAWIFPDWPAPCTVHAAVTTRDGPGISQPPFGRFNLGLRSGDDVQAVRGNRSALRQSLNLPAEPRWLKQVHGTVAAELGPLPTADEPEADAAVSRVPGTVLAILTADCLPVLVCADDGTAIGAAHAGWRGLAAGVLEETIEQMQRHASDLMVWIGPCIGAASYEVGEDVYKAFNHPKAAGEGAFVATRPGHWLCDLALLARQRLQAAGVTRIYGGGFDTRTDARFYSYRREGARSGRFASLIWLADG
jgi:polyphenol oxidase